MLILLDVTDSTRSTHDFLVKINKPGKMENQNLMMPKKHPGLLALAVTCLENDVQQNATNNWK